MAHDLRCTVRALSAAYGIEAWGRTRVGGASQRGCSQGTLWRLAAEAVLEVVEVRGALGAREVRFHMLEGDFKVRAAVRAFRIPKT